jgi:hypothetical protein
VGAGHVIRLGDHLFALPSLPGHRGYARETVGLSHQLDGMLRITRGAQLLLTVALPLKEQVDRRPAHLPQKKKHITPRIYNFSGHPALAAAP